MATTRSQYQNEEVPQPDNLRNQLALAVRTIQWSYAIFWFMSPSQQGTLEWHLGYYNGDIKTRKTVQAVELEADQLGLQRSDQLRELYESLLLGETNPQSKRPTAALSPEDLTDAEWYFLVCMSFKFNIGQGLPGRTKANNQTSWMCNAHVADTKIFTRSLLAKSASMQTIVCFPHLEGVVELGTTEPVPEDLNLIRHIKTTFLESPATFPNVSNYFCNNVASNNFLTPEIDTCSPNNSSEDFADNVLIEDSNLAHGINENATWQFMDDAISNCLNISATSSDCVSQTCVNPETMVLLPDKMKAKDNFVQECNQQKQNLGGAHGNDIHYQSVLSNLLKSSQQLIFGPYFRTGSRVSSFVGWKKDPNVVPKSGTPQKLLKKVLFEVARMHQNSRLESGKGTIQTSRPAVEEMDRNHVLSERKRREKMNERFMILGSLIPSGGKVDKVSILDHTIEYLRQLEKKVSELQSYHEPTIQTKPQDLIERISDNCCINQNGNIKKQPLTNKRKACVLEKNGPVKGSVLTVNISDKIVSIEMSCPWKESMLLEIMEAIKKLNLDSETVQSSNVDGMLSMTIKAKSKGLKVASASTIRQALQKVIRAS